MYIQHKLLPIWICLKKSINQLQQTVYHTLHQVPERRVNQTLPDSDLLYSMVEGLKYCLCSSIQTLIVGTRVVTVRCNTPFS